MNKILYILGLGILVTIFASCQVQPYTTYIYGRSERNGWIIEEEQFKQLDSTGSYETFSSYKKYKSMLEY